MVTALVTANVRSDTELAPEMFRYGAVVGWHPRLCETGYCGGAGHARYVGTASQAAGASSI